MQRIQKEGLIPLVSSMLYPMAPLSFRSTLNNLVIWMPSRLALTITEKSHLGQETHTSNGKAMASIPPQESTPCHPWCASPPNLESPLDGVEGTMVEPYQGCAHKPPFHLPVAL